MSKNRLALVPMACWLLLCGCTVTVTHVPHESLKTSEGTAKLEQCVTVADLGDTRDNGMESRDRAGWGVSYWLPVAYNLTTPSDRPLYVSQFIADSIVKDLKYLGYDSKLLNSQADSTITREDALGKAKQTSCSYLVTSKVSDAKTNYWGFLVIPFAEPVWTRLGIDLQLIDLKNEGITNTFDVYHKDTEWYFGKITVFDAIFDAGLFGRHWLQTAWGETVIPQGIAQGVLQIHEAINQRNASASHANRSGTP